ncbi:MAG TPA: bifunctional UDP-sugar hydrolase/5'-nucleotidase [Bacteroidales bacterium]|nr:bifunctional UDP-sugar hydrolase/5'-nucleotidase [Bacteroidales bacterium]
MRNTIIPRKLRITAFFTAIISLLMLTTGFTPSQKPNNPKKQIVILYDNDVHCSVEGYAAMAAQKAAELKRTPNVLVVSAGDYIQGGSLGAASKGEYIVRLINSAGYDYVTLGNHEFDYGMTRLAQLAEMLEPEILCCNLYDLRSAELIYKPYAIRSFGRTKVAIIGIATPYSFISSTPSYFQNENGEYLYSLCADNFYETIQKNVDRARAEGADFVIVISHLGDDVAFDEINSPRLATSTHGIDVILDGHAHSIIHGKTYLNAKGEEVILTSTGSNFENIGRLSISRRGIISTELIPIGKIKTRDANVVALTEEIQQEYKTMGERKVCVSEADLIMQTKEDGRLIRFEETGLGDFCADAVRGAMGTEIGFMGGGSIRANIAKGEVTFNDLFMLFPFGNTIATAEMTGQQIADALEFSVSILPVEFGGFLQVSGLKFDVDVQTDSPVTVDINKVYSGMVGDQRRVRNLLFEYEPGKFEPIDPERIYTVAGSSYLLKEQGDGFGVLKGIKVYDTGVIDLQILERYITEIIGGVIPEVYGKPQGRINIIY